MSSIEKNTIIDYALKQGVEFDSLQSNYLTGDNVVHLALLEETSSPHLGSMVEGLENPNIEQENTQLLDTMKTLETKFNTTLAEYTSAYSAYMNNLLTEDKLVSQWKGKNILQSSEGGSFDYVNNFGYTRTYSQQAWSGKPTSCPGTTPSSDSADVYAQLKHGSPLGTGEPCGLEGTNVRNPESGEIAWLTPQGVLRHYPDEETMKSAQKNGGCPTGYSDLTSEAYSSMNKGAPMNSQSKCDTMGLDNPVWHRIKMLNEQLLEISDEMYQNVLKLEAVDTQVNTKVSQTKDQLKQRILDLQQERLKFNAAQTKVVTMQADMNDNSIVVKREYAHYLAWTIGAITFGLVALHHVTKK